MSFRAVIIEADGGSRGNPGRAAYGAVLLDADSREVIAEKAATIGVATNNVAEYRGLIAGLELYHEFAEGAQLEVRLDSKLVVEQMSGRWKIKHPDMRPLALQANRLVPSGASFTWIPREQNTYADRILNDALDGVRAPAPGVVAPAPASTPVRPLPPWGEGAPTTLVLVRHGETDQTRDRKFSGRGGSDPGLNDEGRAQARATGAWLAPLASRVDALVSSPLTRTRETADILAEFLDQRVETDAGLAEAAFGAWDGLTYAEARERDQESFDAWVMSVDRQPGGNGESLLDVHTRVCASRERLVAAGPGRTVVVVSHLTPIKLLLRDALQMPTESIFRTELSPARVTVVAWYPSGYAVVRLLNGGPTGALPA